MQIHIDAARKYRFTDRETSKHEKINWNPPENRENL